MASTDSIPWEDITAAGIDTDFVELQRSDLGGHEFVWESGDVRVVFGPAVDMEAGGTHGWAVVLYSIELDASMEVGAEAWCETAAEALAQVKAWTA